MPSGHGKKGAHFFVGSVQQGTLTKKRKKKAPLGNRVWAMDGGLYNTKKKLVRYIPHLFLWYITSIQNPHLKNPLHFPVQGGDDVVAVEFWIRASSKRGTLLASLGRIHWDPVCVLALPSMKPWASFNPGA